MAKRICLYKLHRTLLIEKILLNWNWGKMKTWEWEWDFLEVSSMQNEDMISWEGDFLEESSINGD